MKKSVKLHPEHGLNPTIPVCFWCEKAKNAIVLLGGTYKGEAPVNMVVDYEPCDNCKASMAQGIVAIQVDPILRGERPSLDKRNPETVPTGRWCVIKRDAAKRIIGESPIWPDIDKAGKFVMTIADWVQLGLPTE